MSTGRIVYGPFVDELDNDPMVQRITVREDWRVYICCGEEITLDYVGSDQYRLTSREIPV